MKIIRVICAENIIRDIESGQIVIYNLYDEIKSSSYPVLLSKFCIYILGYAESTDNKDDYSCILKIKNGEETLFKDDISLHFRDKNTAKSVIKFTGLAVPTNGELRVEMYNHDETELLNQYIIILSLKSITKKMEEE